MKSAPLLTPSGDNGSGGEMFLAADVPLRFFRGFIGSDPMQDAARLPDGSDRAIRASHYAQTSIPLRR